MTLEELIARRTEVLTELERTDLSAEDIDGRIADAEALTAEITRAEASATRARDARAALTSADPARIAAIGNPPGGPAQRTQDGGPPHPSQTRLDEAAERMTIGQRILASEELAEFRSRGARGSIGVDVPELSLRTLITGGADAGTVLQQPALVPGFVQQFQDRVPRVVDLLDRGETTNNSVIYIRDDTPLGAGAAAEIAEGIAKPESQYIFSRQTAPVATIAHWVPATRQVLDDNSELRTYLDGRLLYGLEFRLDVEALSGNGAGSNMTGIRNSGIQAFNAAANEQALLTARRALTKVQQREYAPTGYVINPVDWERIELARAAGSGELMINQMPTGALGYRLWGLPVAVTTAQPAGKILAGDFRQGATLFDRMQAQILMSDSHADLFIKNVIVLLAELRAALVVWRPAAFCEVTLDGAGL